MPGTWKAFRLKTTPQLQKTWNDCVDGKQNSPGEDIESKQLSHPNPILSWLTTDGGLWRTKRGSIRGARILHTYHFGRVEDGAQKSLSQIWKVAKGKICEMMHMSRNPSGVGEWLWSAAFSCWCSCVTLKLTAMRKMGLYWMYYRDSWDKPRKYGRKRRCRQVGYPDVMSSYIGLAFIARSLLFITSVLPPPKLCPRATWMCSKQVD